MRFKPELIGLIHMVIFERKLPPRILGRRSKKISLVLIRIYLIYFRINIRLPFNKVYLSELKLLANIILKLW